MALPPAPNVTQAGGLDGIAVVAWTIPPPASASDAPTLFTVTASPALLSGSGGTGSTGPGGVGIFTPSPAPSPAWVAEFYQYATLIDATGAEFPNLYTTAGIPASGAWSIVAQTTVPGTTLFAVVTNLANATEYALTVTATNTTGEGPASAASNTITPDPMPGPLGEIYSQWLETFWQQGNQVECQYGGQYMNEESAPPRVVWVPNGGPIKQTNHAGPGAIRDEWGTVTIWCWGASATGDSVRDEIAHYDVARALLNPVITALNTVNTGSTEYRRSIYAPLNPDLISLGAAVGFQVQFRLPLYGPGGTLTGIGDFTQTATIDGQ
jgi:hypothetical protein